MLAVPCCAGRLDVPEVLQSQHPGRSQQSGGRGLAVTPRGPRHRSANPPSLGCPRNNQIFFGLNRNKPKLNLFWLFFGLLRETKHFFFRFVSVFRTGIETTETN